MKLLLYLGCGYALVLGLMLVQVTRNRRRENMYVRPPEPMLTLKEGQTIVGVLDRAYSMRFYVALDVGEEKSCA